MTPIDETTLQEWEVDNALDADRDDPYAGEDPTDWLTEQAEEEHRRNEHGSGPCTCPLFRSSFCADARRSDWPLSSEAPF